LAGGVFYMLRAGGLVTLRASVSSTDASINRETSDNLNAKKK
jgi:hypothetical protein